MPEANKPRCVVEGCCNSVIPEILFCARCFSNVPGNIQRSLCISNRLTERGMKAAEATHANALAKACEYASAALGIGYVDDDGIGPQSETEVAP